MSPGSRPLPTLVVALALALGSAVSLGLARFSFAMLLPPMRPTRKPACTTSGNAIGEKYVQPFSTTK